MNFSKFYLAAVIVTFSLVGCEKERNRNIDQAEILRAIGSEVFDDYAVHHDDVSVVNALTNSQMVRDNLQELVQLNPDASVIVIHDPTGKVPQCFLISLKLVYEAYVDNGIVRIRSVTAKDVKLQPETNVLWQFPVAHKNPPTIAR